MKKISLLSILMVNIFLAIVLNVILFTAQRLFTTPFPVFGFFILVSRGRNGFILSFGIESMRVVTRFFLLGRTATAAKLAEQLMAAGLLFVLVFLSGLVYWLLMRRLAARPSRRRSLISGLILGLVIGLPISAVAISFDRASTVQPIFSVVWLFIVFIVWGAAQGYSYHTLLPKEQLADQLSAANLSMQGIDRRTFLIRLGGATALITVIGAGLSHYLVDNTTTVAPSSDWASNLPNANDPLSPAPGTRPEYTRAKDHYRIDINAVPPNVEAATYKLDINGLVENPVQITLAEIQQNYASVDQYITMSCISNDIGGDLISTTRWTGTSMQHILDLVKPKPEATYIKILAADGFDEVVAVDAIRQDERIMLAYAWDGEPLTTAHGFPLRIHIPDHYGMKQPKWITSMEFIDSWEPGYWVGRSWDREARVKAVSVVDKVAVKNVIDGKLVRIGGIAWAGARGISRVEVKVDEGTWQQAQLRAPLSDKTWVIWRYDWPFTSGDHSFTVRCFESDGTPQIEALATSHPSGATGLQSLKATING